MRLFINYRRADDKVFVELLRTHFMHRYGRDNVFMDFDSIPAFSRFEDFIKSKIAEADVVVVIIGSRWLEHLQERERLGEKDYVRIEIQEALRLKKPLAPIAIQGAIVPDPRLVPADLRTLFDLNIASISEGQDVLYKMPGIMERLEALAASRGADVPRPVPPPVAAPVATPRTSIHELIERFTAAQQAGDLPLALLLLEAMRAHNVPAFFNLDQQITEVRAQLREAAEAQQRREVAHYLYGFVRLMAIRGSDPKAIRAGLREVWSIEKGYDPDKIVAALTPPLRSYNPLDWGRLYLWLFFQPGRLLDFRDRGGEDAERRISQTGGWLSATLTLLSLLIPLTGVLAGTVGWTGSAEGLSSPSGLLVNICVIWLAIGLLGYLDTASWPDEAIALPGAFVVGLVFPASLSMAITMVFGVADNVALTVALSVAVSVAVSVTVGVILGAALGMSGGVAMSGVSGVVAGGESGAVLGVVAGVAFGLMVMVVGSLMWAAGYIDFGVAEKRLGALKRVPALWQVGLGLLGPLAYAVLIAQYWFGLALP